MKKDKRKNLKTKKKWNKKPSNKNYKPLLKGKEE